MNAKRLTPVGELIFKHLNRLTFGDDLSLAELSAVTQHEIETLRNRVKQLDRAGIVHSALSRKGRTRETRCRLTKLGRELGKRPDAIETLKTLFTLIDKHPTANPKALLTATLITHDLAYNDCLPRKLGGEIASLYNFYLVHYVSGLQRQGVAVTAFFNKPGQTVTIPGKLLKEALSHADRAW